MKFIQTLALLALASIPSLANSITVNCTPFPIIFNGGTGSTTATCPAYTGSAELISATLILSGDYQFGQTGTTSGISSDPVQVKIVFTMAQPAGVTWAVNPVNMFINGAFSSVPPTVPASPFSVAATSGVSSAAFANSFDVSVVSSVLQGIVANSSAGVQIRYSAVPEPGTYALIGGALVGLGLLRRKK